MAATANGILFIKLSFNNPHPGSRHGRKKAPGRPRQGPVRRPNGENSPNPPDLERYLSSVGPGSHQGSTARPRRISRIAAIVDGKKDAGRVTHEICKGHLTRHGRMPTRLRIVGLAHFLDHSEDAKCRK